MRRAAPLPEPQNWPPSSAPGTVSARPNHSRARRGRAAHAAGAEHRADRRDPARHGAPARRAGRRHEHADGHRGDRGAGA